MKFTLSWLQQFIATKDYTPAQIADRLTMLGLEVDSVEELFLALEHIITARVISVEKHPNADSLSLCQVDTGLEVIQVVCGAPNVHAGMISALAKPGVQLPDGNTIKKAKVRGLDSFGMLCSARELGLSIDHTGIMELDGDVQIGQSLRQVLNLIDTVIEVDLTPNRPDCASVLGIAREVGSFTGTPLQALVTQFASLDGRDTEFSVKIADPALCQRYAACRLKNFSLGPSPLWMQRRLAAVGMRPINNIVDITNYVMLECGQPLHAFDFDTISGKQITVRLPKDHEKTFVTLDGNTRTLDEDTLLICDKDKPVALAGVMGGLNSEITDKTTTLLLESACFNPISIRRTARRLGLPSEASYRFERGVDPNLAHQGLQRAVDLMVELAGAELVPGGHDIYPGKKDLLRVALRPKRVETLLGTDVAAEKIMQMLSSIGFIVKTRAGGELEVIVPSFRVDIEREIDLVEEVARLIGFDNIPTSLPVIRMESPEIDPLRALRQQINSCMTSQGFSEVINYSFVNATDLDSCRLVETDPRRMVVRLLNPLNEEQGVLRTLLLPGLLNNMVRNISFQQTDLRLFETGKVFYNKEDGQLPEERMQLCAVMCGLRYPGAAPLYFAEQKSEFVDIKGALTQLLQQLGFPLNTVGLSLQADITSVQPYCTGDTLALDYKGTVIGQAGTVHPEVLKSFDIKQTVFFFELDLERLLEIPRTKKHFTPLTRFPAVKRDLSLMVPERVPAGELRDVVFAQQQKYIESVDIFDVYRGKSLPQGAKSVSLSLTYRSDTATLKDAAVDKIQDKIVKALMQKFDARYREGSKE